MVEVSIIIVYRNAGSCIGELLECIKAQDCDTSSLELILVDSMSTDGSIAVIDEFISNNSECRVKKLQNEAIVLPAGINKAISASEGKYLIRLDAHVTFGSDFLSKLIGAIKEKNESIVGGRTVSVIPTGIKDKCIYYLEDSKFGGGNARFRSSTKEGYVDTLAFAVYKKEIYDNVGLYNESLARTEDNDMHYRMRKAGYKFYFMPDVLVFRKPRSSLLGLYKQKYQNGYWIGRTLFVQPKCFGVRHFAPLLFVLLVIMALLSSIFMCKWFPAVTLAAIYCCASVGFSFVNGDASGVVERVNHALVTLGLLPFFFAMHMACGVGVLMGILSGGWSFLRKKAA